MKKTLRAAAAAAVVLAAALAACRSRPLDRADEPSASFAPPSGKRAFSLSIDKGQTRFLSAGDAVEIVALIETTRSDGSSDVRSEVLAPRAEVLRVRRGWSEDSGLIRLALTAEEVQYAALAVDREDRLFLNKLPDAAKLSAATTPP